MISNKLRLIEHLAHSLQRDLTLEAYKHMPWEQFLELTYGSLAHDPIERPTQPPADPRDEV